MFSCEKCCVIYYTNTIDTTIYTSFCYTNTALDTIKTAGSYKHGEHGFRKLTTCFQVHSMKSEGSSQNEKTISAAKWGTIEVSPRIQCLNNGFIKTEWNKQKQNKFNILQFQTCQKCIIVQKPPISPLWKSNTLAFAYLLQNSPLLLHLHIFPEPAKNTVLYSYNFPETFSHIITW